MPKVTYGKEITLNDVLCVSDFYKNLVYGLLPSKHCFKLVFMLDRFVWSKNDIYVGTEYIRNELLRMGVLTIMPKDINKMIHFVYLLGSFNTWNARLGHVKFETFCRLINLELYYNFNIYSNYKCEVCVGYKITRTSFYHY